MYPMSIAQCPRCSERVSIPDGVSHEAIVRCPLCLEEFSLSDVLQQLPPELVVLSQGEVSSQEKVPSGADRIAVEESSASTVVEEEPEEERPMEWAPAFEMTDRPPSSTAREARRSRRREKSPLGEIIKIAGGGVVGLMIGQLILWWVPGKDPFQLGAKVSGFAPFLVPAEYHDSSRVGAEESQSSNDSDSAPADGAGGFAFDRQQSRPARPRSSEPPAVQDPVPSEISGEQPDEQDRSAVDEQPNAEHSPVPEEQLPEEELDEQDSLVLEKLAEDSPPEQSEESLPSSLGNTWPDEPGDDHAIDLEVPEVELEELAPESQSEEPSASEETAASEAITITDQPIEAAEAGDAPDAEPEPEFDPEAEVEADPEEASSSEFSASVVQERLDRAARADRAWNEAESPSSAQRRQLAREWYRSLASLGEVLTYVDHQEESVSQLVGEVRQLLRGFRQDVDKLDLIGKVAPSWMRANRPHDGVCLYGTATAIERQGSLFATPLEISSGDVVTVISTVDPSAHFDAGSQVLVLGTLRENPAESLEGYDGDAELVVLGGFHLPVP